MDQGDGLAEFPPIEFSGAFEMGDVRADPDSAAILRTSRTESIRKSSSFL